MKTRALVFVSVIGVTVAACGTVGGILGVPGASSDCSSSDNKCKVSIYVNSCSGANNITASPDPVHVPAGTKWKIEWTIATRGYEFTAAPDPAGISFKPGTPSPGGIFSNGNKDAPNKYSFDDDHKGLSTRGSFRYNVWVKDGQGTKCHYDPTVDND